MEFVYFLGRFHVLALHLPIGLVLAAIVLDFLARKPRFEPLGAARTFLWSGAAVTAIGIRTRANFPSKGLIRVGLACRICQWVRLFFCLH